MQVSATCPPLKCDFFNFFAETPFFLGFQSKNQPLKVIFRDFFTVFISTALFIADFMPKGEKKAPLLTYLQTLLTLNAYFTTLWAINISIFRHIIETYRALDLFKQAND